MKLTVSIAEVHAIIRQKYDLLNNVEIEILKSPSELVSKCRQAVEQTDYRGNSKINAIKALRVICTQFGSPLGLANAKFAVENWDKWIAFVESNDRLPKGEYLYSGILE